MKERPLIGITKPFHSKNIAYDLTKLGVWLAGGRSVKLTAHEPHYDMPIDGLILGGGKDVHPSLYEGEEPKLDYPYDHARDAMEIRWLTRAEEEGLPVLGICRGAQLMNIVRGGALHMDVSKAHEKAEYPSGIWARIFYRKKMILLKDSLIHRILRCDDSMVNSMHTQSVDRLGKGLIITAREENDVVQCIEDPAQDYVLGVQFHPEYLIYSRKFRRLFRCLIEVALKRKQQSAAPQSITSYPAST
jgi:putative glutamine amidotransferase